LAGQELQVTTLRQHPDLDLSDHLPAEIAVVDPTGAITCTNRKWEETARIAGLRNPARIVTASLQSRRLAASRSAI
jgi:hypothetical protein